MMQLFANYIYLVPNDIQYFCKKLYFYIFLFKYMITLHVILGSIKYLTTMLDACSVIHKWTSVIQYLFNAGKLYEWN